jgi:hypothetical protein
LREALGSDPSAAAPSGGQSDETTRDLTDCRTGKALDPLRDRPEFRLLMMDLAFTAEPFVRRLSRMFSPKGPNFHDPSTELGGNDIF